jgi:hypothetical protein
LSGLGNAVLKAAILGQSEPIAVEAREGVTELLLPRRVPDDSCTVIALDLAGPLKYYPLPQVIAPARMLVDSLRVSLACADSTLEVRYTTDGSEPTVESDRFAAPFEITASTTVKARSFLADKPVTEAVEWFFRKVEPLKPSEPAGELVAGLELRTYQGDWDRLPDFQTIAPAESQVVTHITSPGLERWGCQYRGLVRVPRANVYAFELACDDGARLTIAGLKVIDADGLHERIEKQGVIALAAGCHEFVLSYFNKTGASALEVRCAEIGVAPRLLPAEWLWHVKKAP